MDDAKILQQIEKLVDEERDLRDQAKGELADEERARLESLEIALDQCWDLLRQRRALREFGENPERAHSRDATTVERYEQYPQGMEGSYRPRVLRVRTAVLMSRPPRWYSSTDAWNRFPSHELYVLEFDGGYEIDWDLSSLLPSRAVILGRAAHDTRQKIPCRMSYPAPGAAGANEGERTSQNRNPPSWDSCG